MQGAGDSRELASGTQVSWDFLTSKTDIIVVLETVNGINLSTNVIILCGIVEIANGRVFLVTTKDLLCFLLPVHACSMSASKILNSI